MIIEAFLFLEFPVGQADFAAIVIRLKIHSNQRLFSIVVTLPSINEFLVGDDLLVLSQHHPRIFGRLDVESIMATHTNLFLNTSNWGTTVSSDTQAL